MDPKSVRARAVWRLAERQHGVIARSQLLELGFRSDAIKHRLASGRLHRVAVGVYAVGSPRLTTFGTWMAAVLSGGPGAALSHDTAAAHWGIRPSTGRIELSVPARRRPRRPGVVVHRRYRGDDDIVWHRSIPVTDIACTLVDIALRLPRGQLEAAINQADRLDLMDPVRLRQAVEEMPPRRGVRRLRQTLDRRTFTLTDSELERWFLRIARRAGLGRPETQVKINGYRVDFFWRDLGLVVETDGLRYHRTPAQQAYDRRRDQVHVATGLTVLRFTYGQIRYEPAHVEGMLAAVARRLLDAPVRAA